MVVETDALTPIMQWPPRMSAQGIPFIEQDSALEVAQCVALLFTTRPGEFIDEPALGLPEPSFQQGGVQEDELEAVTAEWEPRAALRFTGEELAELAQTIDIQVEVGG